MSTPPSLAASAPRTGSTEGAVLSGVYFAYFGAVGIYAPYLALYLGDRGLSPSQATYLLALLPLAGAAATPLWSLLADRLGSAALVLRLIALGTLLSFGLLLLPAGLAGVAVALVLFTVFRAPIGPLTDVLALDWTSRAQGSYGPLRAWGTVGYAVTACATGILVERAGSSAIIATTLGLLALMAVCSFRVPRSPPPPRTPLLPGLAMLVRRPRFLLFLVAATLHQVGLAAYDQLFPGYLTSLAGGHYASAAIGVGTLTEIVFMLQSGKLIARLGTRRTIGLGLAVSAVRWAVLALSANPFVLIGLQALHGVSFGAFYAAAVAFVGEESPRDVRASAQGVFSLVYSNFAVSLSLALAGTLQPHGGVRAIFGAGAVASLAGAFIASRALAPAAEPQPTTALTP